MTPIRETQRLIVVSALLFVGAYGLLWSLGLFQDLGLHGTIAAVLGVLLTTVVGTALMALMFHSNRSGHDRDVYEQTDQPPSRRR